MKKLLAVLLLFGAVTAFADSPITSTVFYRAYEDEAAVILAKSAEGVLTSEIMEILADTRPVDLKMAVINTLGWDFEGKNNAALFWNFLQEKKRFENTGDFLKNGEADDLLCMAYLTAMDDYFDVTPALPYAIAAVEKSPESYTFNIILALIRAQEVMDHNWCAVYKLADNVRKNTKLKMDMRPEAAAIIFEYMDLYKDSCD